MHQSLFEWFFYLGQGGVLRDNFAILVAHYLPYVLVFGTLVLLAQESNWRLRALFFFQVTFATLLARGLVAETIRFLYHHERPFAALGLEPLIEASGYSFPSGHASFFFALSGVIFLWDRTAGKWFLGLSLLNGIARIMVGVHWPLDIFGGIAVGLCSAWLANVLFRNTKHLVEKQIEYAKETTVA